MPTKSIKPSSADLETQLTRARTQLALNLMHHLEQRVPASGNWPVTLAEMTGIGVTTAQRYLTPTRGEYSYPQLDRLIQIAHGLKITLSQLLWRV